MRQPSDYPYDASDPFGGYAGGRTRPHTGSDYFAPMGSPVYAISSGVINHVAETPWNGMCIMQSIDGHGLNAAYLHLSGYNVSNGQRVNEGDVVGWSGNSGSNSRGPHLHLTISDGAAYDGEGNKIDPYSFIASNGGGGTSGLVVDGDFGRATKRALQSALGVTPDGDFGPISTRALQSFLGVTVDGDWGRETTRALQSFLGVTVDGDFGRQSTRALQERLNAGTFVKPAPSPEVTPSEPSVTPEPPSATPEATASPEKTGEVVPAPVVPAAPPAEAVGGINNTRPEVEEKVVEKTYAVTADEYAKIQGAVADIKYDSEDDLSQYDLVSVGFWNYAGERVIKTFAMTFAAMLSTTGAVVVTAPNTANVFSEIGWWYIATVSGVSALTSLMVALSSFKNIATIKKDKK